MPTSPPGTMLPRTPPDANDPAQAKARRPVVATKTPAESGKSSPQTLPLCPPPREKQRPRRTASSTKLSRREPETSSSLDRVAVFITWERSRTARSSIAPGKRGNPLKVTIGSGQLIKGWEEGLPGMRVGETRKLWVPAKMGYADIERPEDSPEFQPHLRDRTHRSSELTAKDFVFLKTRAQKPRMAGDAET